MNLCLQTEIYSLDHKTLTTQASMTQRSQLIAMIQSPRSHLECLSLCLAIH
jgi:hypothetical protein